MTYRYSSYGYTPIKLGHWYSNYRINSSLTIYSKCKLISYNPTTETCKVMSCFGTVYWTTVSNLSHMYLVEESS